MEMLTIPKSKGNDTKKWSEKSIAGPTVPQTVMEAGASGQMSTFVHPAEKPQFNAPLQREKLNDTLF